ncbi:Putative multidrug export ATP-binding/permease protein [Alphaproteobacteria bacterium SO-S41]|nr:Putative multidrug export ATP-binding/permease protein [Alphaproteobacteria bacterium SO-S41]
MNVLGNGRPATPSEPAANQPPLDDIEQLAEAESGVRPPVTPFGFIAFLVKRHYRRQVATLIVIGAIATVLESLGPFALGRLVNAVTATVNAGPPHDYALILSWFAALGLLWLLPSLFYRLHDVVDRSMSPRLRALAQKYLFAWLLGHSSRYFQENFAGKLGQKIKQAGQATTGLLYLCTFDITRIIVLMISGTILLAFQSPFYAAVLVGWTFVYLLVVQRLARRSVQLSKAFSEEVSTSTGRLIDAITNVDLVRAFAKSAFERKYLSRFLADEMNASRRLRRFLTWMKLFMATAMLGLQLALIWMAVTGTVEGTITLGAFTMIFFLGNMIARSVQDLSFRMLDFFEQLGTLDEALALVTKEHEIVDAPDAKPLEVTRGEIAFRHITFAHGDGHPVFRDLDLVIRPGQKVGLVGKSGAGKSTLIKLLRRQFEPQNGTVEIDGQDISRVTWDSLNLAVAEVQQMPGVFHRPIRENIRYANPGASQQTVETSAKQAFAHDFITQRDEGYDTIVGEQGLKLSGGERQRVAIARALVKDAKILVLDEATSSLDSESEHLIQEALLSLMEGRTVIAIAHRLSTIAGMDRIILLEDGQIIEDGSHLELLAKGGAYAGLWNRQIGGFIAS